MIGDATIVTKSVSESASKSKQTMQVVGGGTNTTTSVSIRKSKRRLLTADQVLAMPDHKLVVQITGERPIYARKPRYYEEVFKKWFGGKFDRRAEKSARERLEEERKRKNKAA